MPRKRALSAPTLALALDGSLLLNVAPRLPPATLAKVAATLGLAPSELFVGVPLANAQRAQALKRIDDAAAEVAARIQAQQLPLRARAVHKRRS